MGLFTGLRRRLAAMIDPEEAKWNRLAEGLGARTGGTSTAGKHVSMEKAMRLSAVWACIRLTSQAIASLPIGVYRRGRDGGREEAHDSREAEILRVSPNPDQTAMEFWETLVAWQAATGEGYAEIVRNGNRLAALLPLDSSRVTPTRDRSGNRVYRVTDDQGRNDVLPRDRVFRLPWMDLGRDRGLSPIRYGVNTMGAAMGADEAAAKLFSQGLLASGFVQTDGVLKKDQRDQLQKLLDEFMGSGRAGKIQLLEAGLKWEGITLNPDDAQLLETRRFHVEDIARWFGVPPIIIGHAAQGQTMWGCLTGDAQVFTEHGPRPIRDVRVGESVWSHVDGRMQLRPVLRSGMTGVRRVLTVKTRTRSVRATDNHQFLVRRKFAAPRGGPGGYRAVEWRNVWVRADQLTTDDYLVLSHGLPSPGVETAPNGRQLTEAFMEFCGLYVAEGSLGPRQVCVARADDAPYMDAYRAAMRQCFQNNTGSEVLVREQVRSTAFSSVSAVREMVDLGFAGVASTKRVPGWVFGLTKPLVLAFLRGFVDGDGTVNERGWITWTSISRGLIEDLRHLCMLAGIPVGEACGYPLEFAFGRKRREEPSTVWQAWSFSVRHNRLIGSHDPRYNERLAMAPESERVCRFDDDYVGRGKGGARPGVGFAIDGAVISRVVAVSEPSAEEIPVYDIEVAEAHNFVANGIVVHNSGVEQILLAWLALGINPLARRIEARVRKQLLTGTDLELEFNREGLLQMDSAAKASFLSSMVQNALMSRNEARGKLNLPRREGADALTAQTNLAPLDQLGRTDSGQSARSALLAWLGIETREQPKERASHE